MKLVRRDLKKEIIAASKRQNRNSPDEIFVNDSLTPQRDAVFRTLQRIKRENDVIKGVSSVEGEVFVYTAAPPMQARDQTSEPRRDLRHRVNSKEQLRIFCENFVKKQLEEFVVSWPSL